MKKIEPNFKYQIGDVVNYHPVIGKEQYDKEKRRIVDRTDLGAKKGHRFVYWLEGKAGCVAEEALSTPETKAGEPHEVTVGASDEEIVMELLEGYDDAYSILTQINRLQLQPEAVMETLINHALTLEKNVDALESRVNKLKQRLHLIAAVNKGEFDASSVLRPR